MTCHHNATANSIWYLDIKDPGRRDIDKRWIPIIKISRILLVSFLPQPNQVINFSTISGCGYMRNCYSSNVMVIVDIWTIINDHVHIRCTWTNSLFFCMYVLYIWINCWHGNLTRKGLYCRHDHSAAAEFPSLNCSSPLVANWAWEFFASENTISQRDFRSCGGDHVLLQASVFEDCWMQR